MGSKKRSLIDITTNKNHTNNSFKIISNQLVNGGRYEIKEGKLVFIPHENASELEFKTDKLNVLFGNYYQIIDRNGDKLSAECKSCKSTVKDTIVRCQNTLHHLKRHHTELYEKYKEDVRLYKYRNIEPMRRNIIENEFETNFERILYQKYFQILSRKGNEIIASCRMCKLTLKCNGNSGNFHRHLKNKHPEDHSKYREEVQQCTYEPEDGVENVVEVEFDEEFKRILFRGYFKIIAKTEKEVRAACRKCKRIFDNKEESFSNFRNHLMVRHPDVYKKYKTEVGSRYLPPIFDHKIETQTTANHERVLFDNYFKIVDQKGIIVKAVCIYCENTFTESKKSRAYLRQHLRLMHADVYEKYKEEVDQLKHRQLDIDMEKEIKFEFKSHAAQTLFQEHFRIIEKNDSKLRVSCNHCKSVLKCCFYGHFTLRGHLKSKHAEIYEKYSMQTQCTKNKDLDEVEMTTNNICDEQNQPINDEIESQSKHRRTSKSPNYEGEPLVSITPEPEDVITDLQIQEVMKELINGEFDLSKMLDDCEQGENSDWQQFEQEVGPENFESEHTDISICLQIDKIVDNRIELEYY